MKSTKPNSFSTFRKRKELYPVSQKQNKTPFLLQHSNKLEHKLQKLKSEINQKKKTMSSTKVRNKIQVQSQLVEFLQKLNLPTYTNIFSQNGIDSMDVLKEIKQKQLEEIGVVKSDALKICVSLKKMIENEKKVQEKTQLTKETEKTKEIPEKQKPLEIVIQTQENQQIIQQKKYFCLYCYKRATNEFCDGVCEQSYHKMFERYEKNLQKTEQMFVKGEEEEQQREEQEVCLDFNFLNFEEEGQGFDKDLFAETMKEINDE